MFLLVVRLEGGVCFIGGEGCEAATSISFPWIASLVGLIEEKFKSEKKKSILEAAVKYLINIGSLT